MALPPQTIHEIKQLLEAQECKLVADLKNITGADTEGVARQGGGVKFPEYGNSEEENASEVAQFGDNLSLEHSLNEDLKDTRSALSRIADGTYGTCKYCGKEIDEKRLIARPVSSSCMSCKTSLKSIPK